MLSVSLTQKVSLFQWTVPLRVCFEIDIELWSPAFFVDLVVDLFFVADVFINCRTTYFDANGFRETRPKEIFKNYLRSWFAVDVFSCLPFGYVQYFMTEEVAASAAGQGDPYNNYKGIKAVRLLKISKLIRLTRLKRILMRRGSDMNLQQWMPATFTLIAIVFLCHLLTCGFFAVGTTDEVLSNGERIAGWVEERGVWMLTEGNVTRTDPRISVSVRYVSCKCSRSLCASSFEASKTRLHSHVLRLERPGGGRDDARAGLRCFRRAHARHHPGSGGRPDHHHLNVHEQHGQRHQLAAAAPSGVAG